MTGRTHDLAAFTALTYIASQNPIPEMSLPTVMVAISANFIGGLAPDMDQVTSNFWRHVRGGSYFSRLISPLLGGHRFISHSFLGIIIAGFLVDWLLNLMSNFLLVNMEIVWISFMIGFISHLIADSFTKDGVPWLFPIPINFGIPPISVFRIKTGGIIEKALVFPGLLFLNGYLIYSHYPKFLEFLKYYIK